MESARDWANLPLELLIIIASRMECLQDLVIFSAVCPLWHTAFSMAKSAWSPKMPWLMLAEKHEDNPRRLRTVYDPAAKKQYQMELPETFGRYCHGCGDGWILTLGLDMEIHLFNPHTRARLSLPPAWTLPSLKHYIDFDKPEDRAEVRAKVIRGVTLLRTRSNNELVIVLVYCIDRVTFARPGDSLWRASDISYPILFFVQAIVPFENSVMVVYVDGAVSVFDMDFFLGAGLLHPLPIRYEFQYERNWQKAYCVESGGDLLVLDQHADFTDSGTDMLTSRFSVFKFDFNAVEWKRTSEIGGVAFFVGNNTPIAVRASDSAPCRPECIYFTESWCPEDDTIAFAKDMGVFCLVDEFVDELYGGDGVVTSEFCPPFFYTPKLV